MGFVGEEGFEMREGCWMLRQGNKAEKKLWGRKLVFCRFIFHIALEEVFYRHMEIIFYAMFGDFRQI